MVEREALMHQAEDMLMETGAIVPLYYYNDIYLQKETVTGIYSNALRIQIFPCLQMHGDDYHTATESRQRAGQA